MQNLLNNFHCYLLIQYYSTCWDKSGTYFSSLQDQEIVGTNTDCPQTLQAEAAAPIAADFRTGFVQEIPRIPGDCHTRANRFIQALQTAKLLSAGLHQERHRSPSIRSTSRYRLSRESSRKRGILRKLGILRRRGILRSGSGVSRISALQVVINLFITLFLCWKEKRLNERYIFE